MAHLVMYCSCLKISNKGKNAGIKVSKDLEPPTNALFGEWADQGQIPGPISRDTPLAGSGRFCAPNQLLYAFPWVWMIPQFLDRLQGTSLSAILVAPECTSTSWFPCLQQLMSGCP